MQLLNTLHKHSTWTGSSCNTPPDTVPFGDVRAGSKASPLAGSLRWRNQKGRRVGVASKHVRARRRMHCIRKWSLSCLSQLWDRDAAVRRSAARPFVRSGSRMALCTSWTSLPIDGERRSRNCNKHASDLLTDAVHSPPCPNLYTDCLVTYTCI